MELRWLDSQSRPCSELNSGPKGHVLRISYHRVLVLYRSKKGRQESWGSSASVKADYLERTQETQEAGQRGATEDGRCIHKPWHTGGHQELRGYDSCFLHCFIFSLRTIRKEVSVAWNHLFCVVWFPSCIELQYQWVPTITQISSTSSELCSCSN